MKATYKYCLSLFLEFIFRTEDKAISVNGKSFRIYSALRWELMCFFVKTHLDLNGGIGGGGKNIKDPMALAEEMCLKLTCQPTSEVVHDEEDEAAVRHLGANSLIMILCLKDACERVEVEVEGPEGSVEGSDQLRSTETYGDSHLTNGQGRTT